MILVRPYDPSDYEAVSRIHDAARRTELALAALDSAFLPFSIASEREDFFDYPHIDVALLGGNAAGFCAYNDEELAWLYVDPALWRRGIASRLVEHAMEVEPGIHEVEALFGNEPARKLYEKFGFRVEKIVSGVMPGNETFPVKVYRMGRLVLEKKKIC